jgi:hypothetical protein
MARAWAPRNRAHALSRRAFPSTKTGRTVGTWATEIAMTAAGRRRFASYVRWHGAQAQQRRERGATSSGAAAGADRDRAEGLRGDRRPVGARLCAHAGRDSPEDRLGGQLERLREPSSQSAQGQGRGRGLRSLPSLFGVGWARPSRHGRLRTQVLKRGSGPVLDRVVHRDPVRSAHYRSFFACSSFLSTCAVRG